MERQIITVDIAPGNNQIQRLKSSQGDIGRPLGVYIIQNGVALDCSSYTADLYILKPDGNFFTGTATVDATEHNLITWETAEQETPVAGDCAAQIRILSNGDDIGTARFVEYVEASPGFCGESSESVIDSLKEYVRQAAASAETASDAASSATGSASAASGSASAAASSASAAAGSASTAHTDAETASQAAQTAQDVADSIPEDYSTLSNDVTGLKSAFEQLNDNVITESAGPSPIVSVTDGADGMPMRSVEVAIEPVQDLHGYDAPWPAGGGKNLFNSGLFSASTLNGVTFTPNSDGTITTSGTATATAEIQSQSFDIQPGTYKLNGVANGASPSPENYNLSLRLSNGTIVAICNTEGADASFTIAEVTTVNMRIRVYNGVTANNLVFKPMIRLASVSDASYAPYSNICPISGFDSVKVTRTGKNLFDYNATWYNGYYMYGKPAGTFEELPLSRCTGWQSYKVPVVPGESVTISGTQAQGGTDCAFIGDGGYDDIVSHFGSVSTNGTFVVPSGARYLMLAMFNMASKYADFPNAQIEYGSTATAYESYRGQTYEVTFPSETGTVYGGTLDVVSGKLVVDRAAVVLDGTEDWTWSSSNSLASTIVNGGVITNGVTQHNVYTQNSTFIDRSWALRQSVDGTLGMFYGQSWIYVKYSKITDAESAKAFFANNPTTVVYKLAQSIEIDLTPIEIKTLLGANNIWSDAGNVAITYPADTKMYIDRKITEAVANALNA